MRTLRDHLHMDVYRVNEREWFPTLEQARADAEAAHEWVITWEQGCQAEDGSIQVMRIAIR